MQFSLKVTTPPQPDAWPRVLVTIVIVIIVVISSWAWRGPSGVIAVLAGSGALSCLAPHPAAARTAKGRQ